jgi:hypothetical protein
MTRKRAFIIFVSLACFLIGLFWMRKFAVQEFTDRRAVLEPLVATNASLEVVRSRAGDFYIWRPGTPEWNQVVNQYENGSGWDRYIVRKMKKASAVGHTSTMTMQTWIFLDDRDRLVGFELGTQ